MSYSKNDSQEEQLALLRKIDNKLDVFEVKMEQIHKDSRKAGAVAGGIAGGLAGGFVATGLALIKAKFGFY